MNKRKTLFFLIFLLILLTGISYIYHFHRKEAGFIMDKLGATRNHFNIHVDEEIKPFIYIYWTSETVKPARENSLLVYHRHFRPERTDFPVYGKNWFPVAFNDRIIHSRIGLFRYSPMNHTYDIDISKKDSLLIIRWNIHNRYDPEIIQGCDTVTLPFTNPPRHHP